jgi:hypothetical protein
VRKTEPLFFAFPVPEPHQNEAALQHCKEIFAAILINILCIGEFL